MLRPVRRHQERLRRSLDGRKRGTEVVGDRIEQNGAEALAFASGLGMGSFSTAPARSMAMATRLPIASMLSVERSPPITARAPTSEPDAQGPDAEALASVGDRLATAADALQILAGDQILRTQVGVVHLLAVHGKHSGESGAEDLHHLDGNRIDEAEDVVGRQHLLAEGIELLQFTASAVGVVGFPARPIGELAGNDGSEQKGEECDPVLRIGDGEGANGRQKKKL